MAILIEVHLINAHHAVISVCAHIRTLPPSCTQGEAWAKTGTEDYYLTIFPIFV